MRKSILISVLIVILTSLTSCMSASYGDDAVLDSIQSTVNAMYGFNKKSKKNNGTPNYDYRATTEDPTNRFNVTIDIDEADKHVNEMKEDIYKYDRNNANPKARLLKTSINKYFQTKYEYLYEDQSQLKKLQLYDSYRLCVRYDYQLKKGAN